MGVRGQIELPRLLTGCSDIGKKLIYVTANVNKTGIIQNYYFGEDPNKVIGLDGVCSFSGRAGL
jgi:hypothetical protein